MSAAGDRVDAAPRGGLLRRLHGALMPDYNRKATAYWWTVVVLGIGAVALSLAPVSLVSSRLAAATATPGAAAHRIGVGPWRAPGANMNVFARESHVDVMAAAAALDPVAFRLAMLGHLPRQAAEADRDQEEDGQEGE